MGSQRRPRKTGGAGLLDPGTSTVAGAHVATVALRPMRCHPNLAKRRSLVRQLLSPGQRLGTVARNIIRSLALITPLLALTGTVGSAKENVEIRLNGRFFSE